jgi:hypothetical protein
MKKTFLATAALMLLINTAYADSPIDIGVYSLSGSISYSRANGGGGTMTSITPGFLYFIYPKIAIGASISYWDFKTDNSENKSYGIGPVVRYYFGKDIIYPFGSVEYAYTKNKFESNFSGIASNSTGRSSNFVLGLGFDYFLSRNVALEPVARYNFSHSTADTSSFGSTSRSSSREENFFIGIGINVFIF